MEIHTLFFAAALLLAHGGRVNGEAEDECQQPPENAEMITCCEFPKRNILGHIRDTVQFCAKKVRGNEELSTSPPESGRRRHAFRQRFRDGCFVECLFEREGFLVDNNINKQAIIQRIRNTFVNNEEWQELGSAVVEKCLSSEITVPANETCKSGSAEVFQCINKELFMQCPSWLEDNEYCNSLKNFYVRCPNGPPPEVFPKKKHNRRNRPTIPESEPEEDIEDSKEM